MLEKASEETLPDVGYAWVVAVASFVMQVCVAGTFSGYGVYMEYYSNEVFPNEEKSRVAMIGNLAPTTIAIASIVTGRVCQAVGVRACVMLGAMLMALGHLLASFGTEIWHFALTQGCMVGLGGALIYVPANLIVTEWFVKKRGLAAGLGASGAGIGGVAFAQLNSRLLPVIGYRWTLRVNGGLVFVVLVGAAVAVRRREYSAPKDDTSFHKSLVLNGRFGWYALSSFFGGFAYLIPLYYVNSHAISMDMTRIEAGYAGSAINFGSAAGRIVLGILGDYIGYVRCYILSIFLTTVTSVMWRFSTNFTALMIFGVLYGIPCGGYAGGFGPTCAALFGKRQLATMMGLVYSCAGFGELIGPIICGYLLDAYNNYNPLIYCTIVGYALAFLMMCLSYHCLKKNPPPA
ncbi:hypothetical protein DSO57_1033329 [Entomophthora muscae]|uniref:Uncharacterized protein n=1 Tax=Entomophthora muscae TaxID=34485 RepID=A0ACC2UKL8_9FUNG|nr:hypothetical protein DSO57_1033329 [Entomophthora muscae]